MTHNQINEIVEEYRRCKKMSQSGAIPYDQRRYYKGRIEAIKFTLEVAGVYVKEVALLL